MLKGSPLVVPVAKNSYLGENAMRHGRLSVGSIGGTHLYNHWLCSKLTYSSYTENCVDYAEKILNISPQEIAVCCISKDSLKAPLWISHNSLFSPFVELSHIRDNLVEPCC